MSLCSVADYRTFSGDTLDTSNTKIEAWLVLATGIVSGHIGRPLESAEVSETLRLYPDRYSGGWVGWVYPSTTPVTEVDASGVVDPVTRARIFITNPTVNTDLTWFGNHVYVDVTYTGGYDEDSCPALIKRAIALVARAIGTVNPDSPVVIAGSNDRVGDVVEGNPSGSVSAPIDSFVPGLSPTLAQYRTVGIA